MCAVRLWFWIYLVLGRREWGGGGSVCCESSNDLRRRFYKYSSATPGRVPLRRKKLAGVSIFTQPFPGLWRSEVVMRGRGDMASFVIKTTVSYSGAPRLR